jgi:hypothetical protein
MDEWEINIIYIIRPGKDPLREEKPGNKYLIEMKIKLKGTRQGGTSNTYTT